MNNSRTEIDKWFIEGTLANDDLALPEMWEPIFDPDRHLVHTKIGPYWNLFLRPEGFVKRFYHHIHPLPIENWLVTQQIKLYDGFCKIDVILDIRFQATLKYALDNIDILSGINLHIKKTYKDLLINLINKELANLSDGSWVQTGVSDIEKKISLAVSEMLILQHIQSQTHCTLKPSFEDFPDVQLSQESVYLCVLKKSFEFNDTKREELFRQEQEIEQQKLEHKQKLIDQLNRDAELERLKQAQEALNKKLLLEDQEKQLLEQFEIERRIHSEKVKHDNALKEITLEANLQEQQKHEASLRLAEQKTQMESLTHQARLKEKELEADLENQKRREQLYLEMQKESYKDRKESEVYLRREIELLALEKQRLELQLAIKNAKKQAESNNAQSKK
ncbi:MAG: hypothetical protein ACXV79_07280 [Methylobacter sp.]